MKGSASSVCAPDGFFAIGLHAGIKKSKKDLALIYSDVPCTAAGVFTQNKVKGAPVIVTKDHIRDGNAQAIIINSGIANVSTGDQGLSDARLMAKLAAEELGLDPESVIVASTGVIGAKLPMQVIEGGIKGMRKKLSKDGHSAAKAILTTDKATKEAMFKGSNFCIGAIAKGSGMIYPNMATMLAFITTDAKISQPKLQKALISAVDKSFNMLSVDMQTSTSDMAIVLANGKAKKTDEEEFKEGLTQVCITLAKMIAKDGEGATKLIEAHVIGAASDAEAKSAAKAIITSDLVKAAVYGCDPNWGRITCALGNSGAEFMEKDIKIKIGDVIIVSGGSEAAYDRDKVQSHLSGDEVIIKAFLGSGDGSAVAYGCDLTEEYVKINAHYHT